MTRGRDNGRGNGRDTDGALIRLALWWRSGRLAQEHPFVRDVFVSIAVHESLDRGSFPSAALIATETGRTQRKVYPRLKRLVALGAIERVRRYQKAHAAPGPIVYRVCECPTPEGDITLRGTSPEEISPLETQRCTPAGQEMYPSGAQRCTPQGDMERYLKDPGKGKKKGCEPEPNGARSASPSQTASLAPDVGGEPDREPEPAFEGNGIGQNAFKAMLADVANLLGTVPAAIGEIDKRRIAAQKRELFAKYAGGNNGTGA